MDLNQLSAALFAYVPWIDADLDTILYSELAYYPTLAGLFLLIGLVLMFFYYYPGGALKARYSKFVHWFVWSFITGMINAFVITALVFREVEYAFPGEIGFDKYIVFFAATLLTSFIYTFILSLIMKWGSTDGKSTPF